jgi:hypothetical protein
MDEDTENEVKKALTEIYCTLSDDIENTDNRMGQMVQRCFGPTGKAFEEVPTDIFWISKSTEIKTFLQNQYPSLNSNSAIIDEKISYSLYQLFHFPFYRPICFFQSHEGMAKISDDNFKNIRVLPDEKTRQALAKCFRILIKDLKKWWEKYPNSPLNGSKDQPLFSTFHQIFFQAPTLMDALINPSVNKDGWKSVVQDVRTFLEKKMNFTYEEADRFDAVVCAALYWLFHADENKPICPYNIDITDKIESFQYY